MIFKFQRADGVRNALDRVLNRMRKIIHWINAPCILRIVMLHMRHAINDGVTHIHIWRRHIDSGAQHLLAVLIRAVFHRFKQRKILFHASVGRWIFPARLRQSPSVCPDFIGRKIRNIGFALSNQRNGRFIHLSKIIGRKKQAVFPIRAKPLYVRLNRIDKFDLFFRRIRVIKAQVEGSAIFLCKPRIQQYGFRMSDMQITVWLRRKSRTDCFTGPFR